MNSPPAHLKAWISLRLYCVHICKHCSTLTRNIRNWRKHHRFLCHNLDRYMCAHHLHHTWKCESMKYVHNIIYLQNGTLLGNSIWTHYMVNKKLLYQHIFRTNFCEHIPIVKIKNVDSVLWYTRVTVSGALPSFCWISKLIEFVDKHRIKVIGNR